MTLIHEAVLRSYTIDFVLTTPRQLFAHRNLSPFDHHPQGSQQSSRECDPSRQQLVDLRAIMWRFNFHAAEIQSTCPVA